jgi:hypothetical protein
MGFDAAFYRELDALLRELMAVTSRALTHQGNQDAIEYLDAGEYGLALESILHGIPPRAPVAPRCAELARTLAARMRVETTLEPLLTELHRRAHTPAPAPVRLCPVCGYPELSDPPYDAHGCSSFEICPSCGTEFGYDDSSTSHSELRAAWVQGGMAWWCTTRPPPPGWNPAEQMKAVSRE